MKYRTILVSWVFLCSSVLSHAQISRSVLTPINYTDIKISGELKFRAYKNYNRLEEETYTPEKIFGLKNYEEQVEWPGDIEGRILLGLILEAQATHREPKYLEEMIRLIPKRVNKQGYFGPVQRSIITEQQLSGNGWFLRALCEYYNWKKDPEIKVYIQNIIRNLALPTKGYHLNYPINPAERKKNVGAAVGTTQATIGHWKLSSDIGCDFIFLDGVVQAYEIVPSLELKSLIEEMINRFLQIDLKGINAQTHATLTGVRALLRYYSITKAPYLLKEATLRYNLYRSNAMTANFENFNWFGRPEWTEPCAIVDSYMAAVQLWTYTKNSIYLEDAQHIYYNAIAVTQRINGGFGLSNCTIPNKNSIKIIENEAWWCCTMRGAEGIANAIRYNYFLGPKELIVPFYNTSEAVIHLNKDSLILKQVSDYPWEGKVSFEVMNSSIHSSFKMKLAAPSWTTHHKLNFNGANIPFKIDRGFLVFKIKLTKGDSIQLAFDQEIKPSHMVNVEYSKPSFYTLSYGPLLLGYDTNKKEEILFAGMPQLIRLSETKWIIKNTSTPLSPIYHLLDPKVSKESGYSKQILFNIKGDNLNLN